MPRSSKITSKRKVRPESRNWSGTSRRCAKWRGISEGSPSSTYQEKKQWRNRELAKKAARGEALPPGVFFEIITAPSTRPDKKPLSTVNAIASLDWRAPIITFLHGHYEPVETHNFKRMQARARDYILKDNNLFKLGVCAPLLKCITQDQGMELMREIHGRMCGSHIAVRALAGKAFR
jgi:hypothetical protein